MDSRYEDECENEMNKVNDPPEKNQVGQILCHINNERGILIFSEIYTKMKPEKISKLMLF